LLWHEKKSPLPAAIKYMLHFTSEFVDDCSPMNMSMFTLILHFERKFWACRDFTLAHGLSIKTKYPNPYSDRKRMRKKYSVKNTGM
jgi:hypothetical protein